MREFLRLYGLNNNNQQILTKYLSKLFNHNLNNIIFLCVGTDRIIFDSLGCMVGSLLKKNKFPYYVYGDLNNCITSKNVVFAIDYIRTIHPNSIICVIDALATTDECHLNEIVISDNYISSLSSELHINADLFIYGITTVLKSKLYIGTKLYAIYKLANTIASAITQANQIKQK